MPEDKKEKVEKPKPSERFFYNEEDVAHIFKLGKTGGVFDSITKKEKSNILLKNFISNKKKWYNNFIIYIYLHIILYLL